MASDHTSGLPTLPRDRTVVTAFWILGIVGLLEVVLAAIALTPRMLAAGRSGTTAPSAVSATSLPVSAPVGATPAPAPILQAPPSKPLESTPLKQAMGGAGIFPEMPLHPPAGETAMQGGSSLGIVSTKLEGSDEGSQRLLITIKSRPKDSIDVPQVKVQVYFYDEEDGEIAPSKAQVTSNWMSPPVDWKDGEPELLEVRYLPDSSDPGIKYAGYVVAVYYNGDLQDYRAEPTRLIKLFPLKYFIGQDEP